MPLTGAAATIEALWPLRNDDDVECREALVRAIKMERTIRANRSIWR